MKRFLILLMLMISIKSFAQKVSVGDIAYNIVGTDENENQIDLSEYRGKYILLNFTATNCGPCWKTYDIMNEMQDNYQNKLKVVSFHVDNDKEKWNSISKRMNIDFKCTSIWGSEEKSKIVDIYNIDGFPYFYLINKKGKIIKKWFGNQKNKIVRILKQNVK